MLKGQCLCGAIEYRYSGELEEVVICHCNECKRAQGGPFADKASAQKVCEALKKKKIGCFVVKR